MSRKKKVKNKIRIVSGSHTGGLVLVYIPRKDGRHIHPLDENGNITDWKDAAKYDSMEKARRAKAKATGKNYKNA